ncbi:MAG: hypothetical protein ACYC1E_08885 [Propionibacteriaceae bacterium]
MADGMVQTGIGEAVVTVMDPNGAPTPEAEQQAAADKQAEQRQRQAEREAGAPPHPQARQKSVVEEVAQSNVFKKSVRSAGREIVRGVFGTARRR